MECPNENKGFCHDCIYEGTWSCPLEYDECFEEKLLDEEE